MKFSSKLAILTTAGLVATSISGSVFAGQQPYIATVGDDRSIPEFYISPKHRQFLHSNDDGAFKAEGFRTKGNIDDPEICYVPNELPGVEQFVLNANARTPYNNAGWYEWDVVLPKKPRGNLNLIIQCGLLKPEAEELLGEQAVLECAGETGERIGQGFCTRALDVPGTNPVEARVLPRITAMAHPGPYNAFTPFNLTAYRNPSTYDVPVRATFQTLDGSVGSRIVLKSCMDKTILVKIPVTGQRNMIAGQVEADLEAGDIIKVRMDVPRGHTMDMYCHEQSLRVGGLGDPASLLP